MWWPVVFGGWAMACVIGFMAGSRLSHRGKAWTAALVVSGLAALLVWGLVERSPWIVNRFLRLDVHAALEGVAALPAFMLLMGVAWRHGRGIRQRVVVSLATVGGAACLCYAGFWMLMPPALEAMDHHRISGFVRQSQSFSCVPAACATAVHELGLSTSEAEMAALTRTTQGTGSTLVRAAWGLNRRLDSTPYRADIVRLDWNSLHRSKTPALALTRFEARQRHMITILKLSSNAVLIADPAEAKMWLSREQFEAIFTGSAIVFTPRSPTGLAAAIVR